MGRMMVDGKDRMLPSLALVVDLASFLGFGVRAPGVKVRV